MSTRPRTLKDAKPKSKTDILKEENVIFSKQFGGGGMVPTHGYKFLFIIHSETQEIGFMATILSGNNKKCLVYLKREPIGEWKGDTWQEAIELMPILVIATGSSELLEEYEDFIYKVDTKLYFQYMKNIEINGKPFTVI